MLHEKRQALQAWAVREAVKQFPGSNVRRLAVLTMIPQAVFYRRLIELERLGFVAKDERGGYRIIPTQPSDFPEIEQLELRQLQWHHVNAMTYETATHRIRRICTQRESFWLAERKASTFDHVERIPGRFATMELAQVACARDQYAEASGR